LAASINAARMNRLFLLAAAPTDDGLVIREIRLLRLRALLARAHGDDAAYREYRDRYRAQPDAERTTDPFPTR
jgi:hypothetical protein